MGKRPLIVLLIVCLGACAGGDPFVANDAPRLLADVTLPPQTPTLGRILSPTPTPEPAQLSTATPLPVVTIRAADVVFTTPTLPPSKTPTLTPTSLPTVTATPPPTITPFTIISIGGSPPAAFSAATATAFVPAGAGVGVVSSSCAVAWFFTQPAMSTCPSNAAATSTASYLQLQNGFMFWVGQLDAIYVLYADGIQPRWQVFQDDFADGMPESDPTYDTAPPATWQPRRGFGKIWREQAGVRDRIGWAVMENEAGFTVQLQTGQDGSVLLTDPRGLVFRLAANGGEWARYGG